MARKFLELALVLTSLVAVTACSSSQVQVPSNASIVFQGPMENMTGSLSRPGPGMMYVVDTANNQVIGVFSVPGPKDVKAGHSQAGIGGLKQGKTYTFYFAPLPENNPPATATTMPAP